MAKDLLNLASGAHGLFISSEVDEKRQLIKYVLSNLTLNDENIFWEMHSPFDLMVKCSEYLVWRHLVDMLTEQKVKLRWSLQSVKTIFEWLKIEELKEKY